MVAMRSRMGYLPRFALLGEESRERYDALVQGYRDYFHPVGTVEEVHVEELAILQWRYRRLLQAESAEIQSETRAAAARPQRTASTADAERKCLTVRGGPGILYRGGVSIQIAPPLRNRRDL